MDRDRRRIAAWLIFGVCGGTGGCAPEATDVGSGQQGTDGALDAAAGSDGAGGEGGTIADAAGGGGDGGAPVDAGGGGQAEDGGAEDAAAQDAGGAGGVGGAGGAGGTGGDAGAGGAGGGSGPQVDPEHPCVTVVDLGGLLIFAYEASRPDATADSAGSAAGACSQAGVLPATTVTLAQARDACAAVGYRVCTDAEWYRACVGPTGTRGWPYGDLHEPGRCNDHISGEGHLLTTGAKANCVSPEGLHDLSGNAWERTDDGFRRGASFKLNASMFRTEVSGCNSPYDIGENYADDDVGFRCCR